MRCLTLFLSVLLMAGCKSTGSIKSSSGLFVKPPAQSESPTSVTESKASQTLSIPAGSTIQVVHTPATPSAPESTQTTYTISKDTQQSVQSNSQTISLSPTRKPDTTVELHKADLAERRIILYVAIACLLGGIALKALMPAWPGASTTAWVASGVLFAAWKFSEVPWWAAALVVGLYVAIAGGYKRGEVDERKPS